MWDLDGTLVDTEPYWVAAEYRFAAAHGRRWNDQYAVELVGSDLLDSAHFIRERLSLEIDPTVIVEALLADVHAALTDEVIWRPGARDHLSTLRARGVRQGLVTMSYARLLPPVLDSLPGDLFEVIVTGDRVSRGKPHPDPYLQASAALGLEPQRCLVVEDSETGARAAEAAGCHVLTIPHLGPVTRSPGRTIADALTGQIAMDLLAQVSNAADTSTSRFSTST